MTTADLETGVADSAASFIRPKKHPFTHQGEPCKNCGTALEGWWCHECGQNADTHHRSILHLIWEVIEGLFHLDGRLASTLPLLFFKPGKLAKDYMEGRIVRHVPPFRTFLVALLLFIFAAEHAIHNIRHQQELREEKEASALATPEGRKAKADEMRKDATETRDERLKDLAESRDEELKDDAPHKDKILESYNQKVQKAQDRYAAHMTEADALEKNPNAGAEALAKLHGRNAVVAEQVRGLDFTAPDKIEEGANKIADAQIAGQHFNVVVPDAKTREETEAEEPSKVANVVPKLAEKAQREAGKDSIKNGFKESLAKAIANPEYFLMVMFGWAHRLAVLLLPITGLSLALVYVNKRQYFIYDHLLVATNLLSFSFLIYALCMVLPQAAWPFAFGVAGLWGPINLFQTLRGGYGSSIIGSLLKTWIIWTIGVTSFGVLLAGLMLFTLSQM